MTTPTHILISDIDDSERGRSEYSGIENLANAIQDVGLIEPIIVSTKPDYKEVGAFKPYLLNAGGRRLAALKHLGHDRLYFGETCDPEKPGFLLKGQSVPFTDLLVEIRENLNREDMLWYDQMKLIVKAKRIAELEKNRNGELLVMRAFAATIGVSYSYTQMAHMIHDDWIKSPDDYKAATSIKAAYVILANKNKAALNAEISRRLQPQKNGGDSNTLQTNGTVTRGNIGPTREGEIELPSRAEVRFSERFFLGDGLQFLKDCELAGMKFDHIITDPDYGVSVERLEANSDNQSIGVAQENVNQSLEELRQFIRFAYHVTKDHSFLIFFYDLDHHEKCQQWATAAGWRVQRWPLIWKKTDYRSNAAPSHNFCKNVEYAMVCRKPGATLAQTQMSSIFECATEGAQKQFGHPFAKPTALWRWIYRAVATPGQTVPDPFMGSGSGPCSAIDLDLIPYGAEIQGQHFNSAVVNLKKFYEQKLGPCDFI